MMKTVRVQGSGFRVQVVALLAIAVILLPCVSQAVTKTWTGAGGNRWTGSGNWSPSGLLSAGDDVVFDGTGINLDTTTWTGVPALRSVTFTSGQTETVTITNPTNNLQLSLTYSGIALNVVTGDHKFVGINIGAGTDIKIGAAASTNSVSTGASFEIQGRLNSNSSSDSYVKIGGGTLILSGNNGGSGAWRFTAFTIQEGALRFAATGAAGYSANNFIVSSGAAIELSNNSNAYLSSGMLTINGTGINFGGALRSISGNNAIGPASGTGTVVLASASSIGVDVDGDKLTISKVISGTNSMTKVGAGTLILSTTNTYSGTTVVEAGTLGFGINNAISASSLISLSGGTIAVGTYSNALSTVTLTQDSSIDLGDGTGTLSFSGGTGTWSGTLSLTGTLGEKTLRFGADANGLTAEQQSKIKLNGYSTKLNSQGYVVLLRGTVLMIF